MSYCECGMRLRQWFNDVFSCPRCRTILVRKEHLEMLWSGPAALVLLDEIERQVTGVLLSRREQAEVSVVDKGVSSKFVPRVGEGKREVSRRESRLDSVPVSDRMPCLRCGKLMKAGCGQVCAGCGWIAPCRLD